LVAANPRAGGGCAADDHTGRSPNGIAHTGLQQSAVVVPPIDFETLIAVLPNAPAGWTRGRRRVTRAPRSRPLKRSTSLATRSFTSNDRHVIQARLSRAVAFRAGSALLERTSGRYTKAASVGGSPGFERWDEDAKSAEVTMVVANRIVVSAKGRNVDNANATRALVTAIDQKKLKDIK
jgi:hypothetical protein